MIKNFVKILELLGDRLEVCVSVDVCKFEIQMLLSNRIATSVRIQLQSSYIRCVSASQIF